MIRFIAMARDWLTCIAAIGLVALVSHDFWRMDYNPPVEFHGIRQLSPVAEGEWLNVRIFRTKTRKCDLVSVRWVETADKKVIDIPDASWGGGEPNTPYLDFSYDTSSLPAGEGYTLKVKITYDCEDRKYTLHQPELIFNVE